LNAYPNMLDSELPREEKEKKELALSIEKRYGKRKNFKIINTRPNPTSPTAFVPSTPTFNAFLIAENLDIFVFVFI